MASLHNLADQKPLGIGLQTTSNAAVAVTRRLFCTAVEPNVEIQPIEVRGTTGDRRMHKNEQRQGRYEPLGLSITLPFQFSTSMEWLLYGLQGSVTGTTSATTTYSYSSTLPAFTIERARGSEVETYIGCKVSKVEIGGQGGGPLEVKVDFLATNISVGGSVTSLTGDAPVIGVFHDSSVAAPTATAQDAEAFTLIIDNGCEAIYGTGQKPTCVRPGPRVASLQYTQRDGTAHAATVDKWLGHSADSAAVRIAYSTAACKLTAQDGYNTANLPSFGGGAPGDAQVEQRAYRDDSTPDILLKMTTI